MLDEGRCTNYLHRLSRPAQAAGSVILRRMIRFVFVATFCGMQSRRPIIRELRALFAQTKCVTCHMPKYEPPGFHAKFTDHWIRVVGPGVSYPN